MIEYAGDPLLSALILLEGEKGPDNPAQQLRTHIVTLVCDATLDAYRASEMDFKHAVGLVRRVAAGSGEKRTEILWEFVSQLLNGPQPERKVGDRLYNRSSPPYPEWLKNLAVDLALSLREAAPYYSAISAASARTYVTEMLFRLGLCPEFLSELTLRKWCQERQRAVGKPAPPWRPRRK
jgi:hypothetical protein